MNIQDIRRQKIAIDERLKACRQFFGQHGIAAINVSILLGGERAQSQCIRLISDISDAQALTRSHRLSLINLHKLFTLQGTAEFDGNDTCYVDLQPGDPRVEDICLLADQLFNLLIAIAEDDEISVFVAQALSLSAAA